MLRLGAVHKADSVMSNIESPSQSPYPRLLRIASRILGPDASPRSILDFGCGNGDEVQRLRAKNVDAWGCDIRFKPGQFVEQLASEGAIRTISLDSYRLPFPDNTFDLVLSNQVLEHVQDYPTTLAEIRRVTRPGGLGLHVFPPKWKPVEVHVRAPFASVFRARWWLTACAAVGLCKREQRGRPAAEVASENLAYLNSSTNYLSGPEILAHFHKQGFELARWGNQDWLDDSETLKGRVLARAGRLVPPLTSLHVATIRKILITRR
jgi:ubiquinone/menaquinone biosynthesis C-methylase UbiE